MESGVVAALVVCCRPNSAKPRPSWSLASAIKTEKSLPPSPTTPTTTTTTITTGSDMTSAGVQPTPTIHFVVLALQRRAIYVAVAAMCVCVCVCVCVRVSQHMVHSTIPHDCLLPGSEPHGQEATFLLVGEENRFLAGPCLLHPTHCCPFKCVGLFIRQTSHCHVLLFLD